MNDINFAFVASNRRNNENLKIDESAYLFNIAPGYVEER